MSRAGDLLELAKPRILALVVVATAFAYLLAGQGIQPLESVFLLLLGVGCAAGGAATLNNYRERRIDATRARTRSRALPAGRISPAVALAYGVSLVAIGGLVLAWRVNPLTSFLALSAACLYVLVYTPMKSLTRWSTLVGAVAGAIPMLCGWAAARGRLGLGAWVVFALLFAWQLPHAEVIAWTVEVDDGRTRMAASPLDDAGGRGVSRRVVLFSALTIGVSPLLTLIGVTGMSYLAGSSFLGLVLLAVASRFARHRTPTRAHWLRVGLVIYLPLLLLLAVLDRSS